METKEFVQAQNVITMPLLAGSPVRDKFHSRQAHSSSTKGKSSYKTDGALEVCDVCVSVIFVTIVITLF